MNNVFRRVLLPVDFSISTEIAIKRLIELIGEDKSVLHLVHVINPFSILIAEPFRFFSAAGMRRSAAYKKAAHKLEQWKQSVQDALVNSSVTAEILFSSDTEKALVNKINTVNPELIVVCGSSVKAWLAQPGAVSGGRIASRTAHTVLALRAAILDSRLQTVVVPIGNFVPQKKLISIAAAYNRQHFKIYLVSVQKTVDASTNRTMMETFRYLKSALYCDVECKTLAGDDLMRTAKRFAETVRADAMLIHLNYDHSLEEEGRTAVRSRPYTFNN
jgi:hypothetical protein